MTNIPYLQVYTKRKDSKESLVQKRCFMSPGIVFGKNQRPWLISLLSVYFTSQAIMYKFDTVAEEVINLEKKAHHFPLIKIYCQSFIRLAYARGLLVGHMGTAGYQFIGSVVRKEKCSPTKFQIYEMTMYGLILMEFQSNISTVPKDTIQFEEDCSLDDTFYDYGFDYSSTDEYSFAG